MKHEWKKEEKELYLPQQTPVRLTVPKQQFFMLKGKGDPNSAAFAEKVGVLYSVSYAVRMMPKQGYTPPGYEEYTVYPLEGVWSLTEAGRHAGTLKKEELLYTIMIRQPEFVTPDTAEMALEATWKKKPHPCLEEVTFGWMEDGDSVQMLHVGPYEEEPHTFAVMQEFLENRQLQRRSLEHREIYLSDVRKTAPEKLKTVLRIRVEPK